MVGRADVRLFAYATAVCIALALAGVAWLSYAVIGQGQELSGPEDVALDLLIGAVAVLSLGGLVLRQQSRSKRRHEQEIEQEKGKIDTAISHMSQGLVMFDASQRIALCNRRYIELYGMSPTIVKRGLSFRDLTVHRKECGSFSGDVDEYCRKTLENLAKGKVSSLVITTNDGRVVRVVNTPLNDGGWVATHEEITEYQQALEAREHAEAAVREQKLQLDAALENMTHGLCMFDAGGHILLFNSRYRQLMGETEEYLQGLSLLDLFKRHKALGAFLDDPDEFFSEVVSSMRQGKTIAREIVRGGASLRVVDQPIEGGGWVATYEDITEKRRVERERDENRAFLDLIIENVPSAIFVKRASDRTYVLVNRTGEQFWGRSRGAMIGKTAKEVFPETEAVKIEARDDQLLQAGQPVFDEREILTTHEGPRTIFSRRLTLSRMQTASQRTFWASSMM